MTRVLNLIMNDAVTEFVFRHRPNAKHVTGLKYVRKKSSINTEYELCPVVQRFTNIYFLCESSLIQSFDFDLRKTSAIDTNIHLCNS